MTEAQHTVDQLLGAITAVLSTSRYFYTNEVDLHRHIDKTLTRVGIPFEGEVRLSPRDRIDYMVGPLGVEVKVAGKTEPLRRQLARYAEHDQVEALLVVTTQRRHRIELPTHIGGKTLSVLVVGGLS